MRWKRRCLTIGYALLAMLILVACQAPKVGNRHGRLVIWHDWPEPESGVLQEILHSYEVLYPEVRLVTNYVPSDQIAARFAEDVATGLGPDLLIGLETHELYDFVEAEQLLELTAYALASDHFQPQILDALRHDKAFYGVPFAASTSVMFYNTERAAEPVATLDEMVVLARRGDRFGIPIGFGEAYWGVDAFNGTAFRDADVDPNAGFGAWLTWALQAQAQPSILFDGDKAALRGLFMRGEIDYYVGQSSELNTIRQELSDDNFSIASLPAGTNPFAGALLDVETLTVNRYTSKSWLAVDLVSYLTNMSNQRKIAHGDFGRIPVNVNVKLDPRISDIEATLLRQQQRAITLPFAVGEQYDDILAFGDTLYLQVMQGVLEPGDAAERLRLEFSSPND